MLQTVHPTAEESPGLFYEATIVNVKTPAYNFQGGRTGVWPLILLAAIG